VQLDPNQYHLDMQQLNAGGDDVYTSFNLIVRRKAKENNFKAVRAWRKLAGKPRALRG